jgi:hypothetical protein
MRVHVSRASEASGWLIIFMLEGDCDESMGTRSKDKLTRLLFALVPVVVLLLSGCASVRMDATEMGPPVCLNDPVPIDILVLEHFRTDAKAHFGFFGFITWTGPSLRQVLEEEVAERGGQGAINVSVRGRFSPIDILLGIPLCPLWFSRTYTVEGDVVRIQGRSR